MLKYIYRHFGNRCLEKIFESHLEIPREIYIFERSLKDPSKIFERHPKTPRKISIFERHPEIPKAS